MIKIEIVSKESAELSVVRTLFKKYAAQLNEDLDFQGFAEEIDNPLKKYGPPNGKLFIARWENEIAGCIAYTDLQKNHTCEMKRLYVLPAFRKHHIGKALVLKLLETAAEDGFQYMVLDTLSRLVPAIRLYESVGFKPTEPYYDNPLPNVIYMNKKLV